MSEFMAAFGAANAVFGFQSICWMLSTIDASKDSVMTKWGHNMIVLFFGTLCFFPFFHFTLPVLRGVS